VPAGALTFRHQRVQRLRRLVHRRSARQAERAFVVEGAKVLGEALAAGVGVEGVYAVAGTDLAVLGVAEAAGVRVFDLAPGVLERVAGTVTPQPVMAVVPFVDVPMERVSGQTLVVVLVDVRDPGNAGTVLRSAEASGAGAVICCEGSVDLFNPKTVRASAGSLFHVPVVVGGDAVEVLEQIGGWGVRRLATAARGGADPADLDLCPPLAFVLGNEAHGLPLPVTPVIDGVVTIPLAGRSESLNVGMAAAVLCFEAARQRRNAPPAGGGGSSSR
jgi:TrmH family RNA methyltransferase